MRARLRAALVCPNDATKSHAASAAVDRVMQSFWCGSVVSQGPSTMARARVVDLQSRRAVRAS